MLTSESACPSEPWGTGAPLGSSSWLIWDLELRSTHQEEVLDLDWTWARHHWTQNLQTLIRAQTEVHLRHGPELISWFIMEEVNSGSGRKMSPCQAVQQELLIRLIRLIRFITFIRLTRFITLIRFIRLIRLTSFITFIRLTRFIRLIRLIRLTRFMTLERDGLLKPLKVTPGLWTN
ncbi:hypothetical protein INR49_022923, partial [Caranx melampygus]